MSSTNFIMTAVLGLALVGASHAAVAAPADYQLEPVVAVVKNAPGAEIKVRLTHKPTGKPVGGAIVFRSRLDMSPENMAEHAAPVEPLPPVETGEFRFKADFGMAGKWALKLMVKVPGENETIQGTVIFTAKD